MRRFILRRLLFFVLTLLLTSLIVFALTRILPGDVARVLLGREASAAQIAAAREELGLDEPLIIQYGQWLVDLTTGHWGKTFTQPRQPIRQVILPRLGKSIQLAALILAISVPLAIILGVITALVEGGWLDMVISTLMLAAGSLPEFVTGLFLINVVALQMGLLRGSSSIRPDATFLEALPGMWLPAITATLVLAAYIARLTRAGIIHELKQEYVRTAVLKGLPYPVVLVKHVLRNALLPAVTVIATSTGWLVSGLVVIEFVYSYPGLGQLLIFAIDNRDLPLIQAVIMITVIVLLAANFAADLLYAVLNPRITLS